MQIKTVTENELGLLITGLRSMAVLDQQTLQNKLLKQLEGELLQRFGKKLLTAEEKEKHERTANFHKKQEQLHLWVSPNMHGWRDCSSEKEAAKLIEESGVKQNLNVE